MWQNDRDWNAAYELAHWYLKESGQSYLYLEAEVKFQRLGQAFFNALSYEDQRRIRDTAFNPFYADGRAAEVVAIRAAVDFLTKK